MTLTSYWTHRCHSTPAKQCLSAASHDLSKLVKKCSSNANSNSNGISITIHSFSVCFAVELAMIMDRLYGGVCYAGIDTDPELRYPVCIRYSFRIMNHSANRKGVNLVTNHEITHDPVMCQRQLFVIVGTFLI